MSPIHADAFAWDWLFPWGLVMLSYAHALVSAGVKSGIKSSLQYLRSAFTSLWSCNHWPRVLAICWVFCWLFLGSVSGMCQSTSLGEGTSIHYTICLLPLSPLSKSSCRLLTMFVVGFVVLCQEGDSWGGTPEKKGWSLCPGVLWAELSS